MVIHVALRPALIFILVLVEDAEAGSARRTGQADGADVADLDEVAVAEAGRSVVDVDRRRKHQM